MSNSLKENNGKPNMARRYFIFFAVMVLSILYFFEYFIFLKKYLIAPEITSSGVGDNKYTYNLLAKGVLPAWAPEIDLGYPIIADPNITYWFHPINILFFFLPPHVAHNILTILAFALNYWFTFLFARANGISWSGSIVSALVFTYSAIMVAWTHQFAFTSGMIWLPLILYFIHQAFEKRNHRYYVLGGVVFGFQFFQTQVQLWSYTLLLATVYIIYQFISTTDFKRDNILPRLLFSIKGFALVLGVGLGISAVQFVPLLELSQYTGRMDTGTGLLSFQFASYLRLNLSDFVAFIFPDIYGAHFTPSFSGFNSEYFPERMGYIGMFPLILAFSAMLLSRKKGILFFTIIMYCSIFLAMSRDTPLYLLQYYLIPGFDNFRIPLRYLFFFAFSGAVLAGFAFDGITERKSPEEKPNASRLIDLSLYTIAILGILIYFINYSLHDFLLPIADIRTQIMQSNIAVLKSFLKSPLSHILSFRLYITCIQTVLLSPQLLTMLFFVNVAVFYMLWAKNRIKILTLSLLISGNILYILLAVFIYSDAFMDIDSYQNIIRPLVFVLAVWSVFKLFFKQTINKNHLGYLLLIIIVIDLVGYNKKYLLSIEGEYYKSIPNTLKFIKKDDSRFRTFPVMDEDYPKKYGIQPYSTKTETYYRKREAFFPSLLFGTELLYWEGSMRENSLSLKTLNDFHNAFDSEFVSAQIPDYAIKILSLLNVKYLIRTKEAQSDALELVYSDEYGVKIYENKEVMARTFFVSDYKVLGKDKILNYMKSKEFDPRKMILIEEEPIGILNNALGAPDSVSKNTPEITNYGNNKITINTYNTMDGFSVLSDSYYPGWNVYVDGHKSKIYRANYVMRAVFVPRGNHIVEFRYEPFSFKLGFAISLMTLGIALFYLYKSKHFLYNATAKIQQNG